MLVIETYSRFIPLHHAGGFSNKNKYSYIVLFVMYNNLFITNLKIHKSKPMKKSITQKLTIYVINVYNFY